MLRYLINPYALKILILISAIFPFIGYLIGYSYYNGYMESFGLSGSEFPLSLPEIYYYAYVGIGDGFLFICTKFLLNKKFFYYMFFACFIILIVYSILNKKSIFEFFEKIFDKIMHILFRNLIVKLKSNEQFHLKFIEILNKIEKIFSCFKYSKTILLTFEAFLICIMIYILPSIAFNHLGKEKAINLIKKFIKNECKIQPNEKLNSCINIIDENKKILYSGKLIAYNVQNNTIAIMQQNEINLIQLKPDYIINKKHFCHLNDK